MTTLADPTLFPIPPNAEFSVTLSRAWLTDIQRTRSGKEIRQALRERVARRLEYTASLYRVRRLDVFQTLWLTATEPLRFLVPLWSEYTIAAAFPDATTITADTRFREFVEGGQALLWRAEQDAEQYELVTIATLADGGITTEDPIDAAWADYPAGSVKLVPVIGAWLVPPTKDQVSPKGANVPLAFDEELPGVAGIDATVGAAVTPDVGNIFFQISDTSGAYAGLRYFTISLFAFDYAGVRIREPAVTWVVTEIGSTPAVDPRHSFPRNQQQCYLQFTAPDVDTLFNVQATVGGVTISTNIPT